MSELKSSGSHLMQILVLNKMCIVQPLHTYSQDFQPFVKNSTLCVRVSFAVNHPTGYALLWVTHPSIKPNIELRELN